MAIKDARKWLADQLDSDSDSDTECVRTFFSLATFEREGGGSISDATAALKRRRVSEASVRAIVEALECDGVLYSTKDAEHFASTDARSARGWVESHFIYFD